MNILLLGSGGREHALAWAIRQNPKCDRLVAAPGNPGMADLGDCIACDILDPEAVVALAAEVVADFVVIGPEAPLAAGVSDALRAAGFLTFGPSRAAAMLEASKAFTKDICDACGAPTAAWARFSDHAAAAAHVRATGTPIVIKADGLMAGKGVTVAMTLPEALDALDALFAAPGGEVVIEEFMPGEEASFFVLCDGTAALPVGTAQDHKRAFDGDEGPNTGGMGACSPAPVLTGSVAALAMDRIIRPTLAEMARRGTPYQGVLYAGLMIADGKPRLVEYNVRFGDPECQVLMARLGAQALDLMLATAEGRLAEVRPHWADDHAICVVMAARGYPGDFARGEAITLPDATDPRMADPRVQVFHAGTARREGRLVSNGGRVLGITARADTLAQAQSLAYAATGAVNWPGGFYRRDIGRRALARG
jgi:phosphoribosylamine--glycine ligase